MEAENQIVKGGKVVLIGAAGLQQVCPSTCGRAGVQHVDSVVTCHLRATCIVPLAAAGCVVGGHGVCLSLHKHPQACAGVKRALLRAQNANARCLKSLLAGHPPRGSSYLCHLGADWC